MMKPLWQNSVSWKQVKWIAIFFGWFIGSAVFARLLVDESKRLEVFTFLLNGGVAAFYLISAYYLALKPDHVGQGLTPATSLVFGLMFLLVSLGQVAPVRLKAGLNIAVIVMSLMGLLWMICEALGRASKK